MAAFGSEVSSDGAPTTASHGPSTCPRRGPPKAVLVAEPGLIQFSPTEVSAEHNTKEISVFNSQAINWSTLYVHIKPPCADIIETAVHPDHVKLTLRANPSSEEADFSAILRLTADLETAEPGAKTCSLSIPVQGSQHIDIQVLPRVVFASWSRDEQKGAAHFLVRGLKPELSSSISSISCDGFRAAWESKDVLMQNPDESRILQVDLTLSEPVDPGFDATQARRVRIAFASGQAVDVPVYFVPHQARS